MKMTEDASALPFFGTVKDEEPSRLSPTVSCGAEGVFLSRNLVADLDNIDLHLGISPEQDSARESVEAWCGGMLEFDFSTFAGASEALGADALSFGAPMAATVPVAGSDSSDLALGLHGRSVDFLYTSLFCNENEIFAEDSTGTDCGFIEHCGHNETVLNLHYPSYNATGEAEASTTALIQAQQMLMNG